jgi:tRNA A-37 threonylcarbamoyl transferase component Bud32
MTLRAVWRPSCKFEFTARRPAARGQERRAARRISASKVQTAQRDVATAGAVVLGRYALLERLGAGGFGTVWLARDERLDREVAIKRIPIANGAGARAEREALAAARLSHPAIVALYEAGRDDESVYLVSELVRGATLADLLEEGALSDRDVLLIGAALCDALSHAHARGVVHRDVKPGNVLVPEAHSDGGVAKLTDFGIARMAGDDALTATGDVVGTLAYMAPEHAEGRGATAASDLYALGLVLYEALAGVNPIRRGNAAATARRVGTRLPPLRRMRRDLPRALCAALDAAVAPDPAMRGSVASLRGALAAALPEVDDEPGAVDGPWGVGWSTRDLSDRRSRHDDHGDHGDDQTAADHLPLLPNPVVRVGVAGRLLSAALTAALVPFVLSLADTRPPVEPLAAAAIAATLVAQLPRVGWIALAGVVSGWLASSNSHVALLVGAGALAVPLLAPRAPAWWSAPGAAVGLGFAMMAGAFPAVAGQARGVFTRAALGALGYWWLALAEALLHRRLLAGPTRASLAAIVQGGALGIAAVWAIAAALLPLLVRGRSAAWDLLAACAWAAGLALGTSAVAEAAGAGEPRGLLGAAALGALLAVLARALRP